MAVNNPTTDPDFDPDEAPDLTREPWASRIRRTPVAVGRPRLPDAKVQTTLRLDPDVLDAFKADGPGWQTRMNAALRKAAGL